MSLRENLDKKLWRELRIYRWNILWLLVVGALTLLASTRTQEMTTHYEQYAEENTQVNAETLHNVDYYYYLDFSPSMSGFFDERVNSEMSGVAEALESINDSVRSRSYYRCADVIERVDDVTFYSSMKELDGYIEYYDSIIKMYEAEQNGENVIEKFEDIDLTKVFYDRYQDGGKYATERDSIKIIITDFTFAGNEQGTSEESLELLFDFADELAKKNSNANIGIYQLHGSFIGEESDVYMPQEETTSNVENRVFYVLVMSENMAVYSDFTERLEAEMIQNYVDCSEKYELLNQVTDADFELKITEDDLLSMGFSENETLNMDNSSFHSLEDNEIALRVVKGAGNVILNAAVSLGREGDALQTDAMEISMKPVVSRWTGGKQYEEYKNEDIIKYLNGVTEWRDDGEYLKFSLELNPEAFEEGANRLKVSGRNYYVLELQFFIEKPSFAIPEWLSGEEEDLRNLAAAFQRIVDAKKKNYAELQEVQRYLGNLVIYLTY